MEWTDCAIIEQVQGRMSGAPVLRGSRVRPQDILSNVDLGADWIAQAHNLPVSDVRAVLDFYKAHHDVLPLEYVFPERLAALGADAIDWSGCAVVEDRSGEPVIRGTPVRPIDLIANLAAGEESLAFSYSLPPESVHLVIEYYTQRMHKGV